MSLLHNAIINSYSIVLLFIIGIHHSKSDEKDTLQYRLYIWLININIILLFVDILGRFDGNPGTFYPIVNHIGNFLLFLLNPVLPSIWFLYVHHQIYRNEKMTRQLIPPLIAMNAVNMVFLILSQFNGYYYTIDSGNVYHRGRLYLINVLFVVIILFATIIIVFRNRHWLSRKQFLSLLSFPFFPGISIILQTLLYGTSLQLNSTVISLLMIFLNIQNEQIYTDYLTGLNNRKRLDDYFRKKLNAGNKDCVLSAIMIDVDNFKSINDTFGHKTGDDVLQNVAKILNETLEGKHFIARFGGDEFCIVLDHCNLEKLETVRNSINRKVDEYNRSGTFGHNLSLSMGYAVYDDKTPGIPEFYNKIDKLMYQDKKRKEYVGELLPKVDF